MSERDDLQAQLAELTNALAIADAELAVAGKAQGGEQAQRLAGEVAALEAEVATLEEQSEAAEVELAALHEEVAQVRDEELRAMRHLAGLRSQPPA